MAKRRLVVEVDCEVEHCAGCEYLMPMCGWCALYRAYQQRSPMVPSEWRRSLGCLAAEVKEPADG